jgi:hypothetical protein
LFITNIVAFAILVIPDIIAISDISTFTIGGSKKCKNVHNFVLKKNTKIEEKCTHRNLQTHKNMQKNSPKKYKKCKKKNAHRNCKNHTKNAKNDISGITDILPGLSPYWLSPITSFHHVGYP